MRSRYAAFALRDAAHLRETWHPGTRPVDVEVDDETTWLGLTIVDAPAPAPDATRGIVEFEARFVDPSGEHILHERSRFVRQSGRWWYLDGVHS